MIAKILPTIYLVSLISWTNRSTERFIIRIYMTRGVRVNFSAQQNLFDQFCIWTCGRSNARWPLYHPTVVKREEERLEKWKKTPMFCSMHKYRFYFYDFFSILLGLVAPHWTHSISTPAVIWSNWQEPELTALTVWYV